MPEDWFSSDFDHWFWLEVRFFGDSGTEATGEDDGFHFLSDDFLSAEKESAEC